MTAVGIVVIKSLFAAMVFAKPQKTVAIVLRIVVPVHPSAVMRFVKGKRTVSAVESIVETVLLNVETKSANGESRVQIVPVIVEHASPVVAMMFASRLKAAVNAPQTVGSARQNAATASANLKNPAKAAMLHAHLIALTIRQHVEMGNAILVKAVLNAPETAVTVQLHLPSPNPQSSRTSVVVA